MSFNDYIISKLIEEELLLFLSEEDYD